MSDSPQPRAVAFDLDGLMFNTEDLYQHVGSELLRRRGKVLDQDLVDRMMGLRSAAALQIMIDTHQLSDTVERLEIETDEIFDEILEERLEPMPGLLSLLTALESAGIPKAVATSARATYVQTVLSLFDLGPRFDFVLTAEDVEHGKPHPEIYLSAAGRFGVAPSELLVLEDSENGCRAAVRSGAFAVAVPGRLCQDHDFTGVALLVNSLQDRRLFEVLQLDGSRQ